SLSNEESFLDKKLEKELIKSSESLFKKKTLPTLLFAKEIGNMYTPSLYGCLVSHLLSEPIQALRNTRVCLFSYGSGSASAMFSVIIQENSNSSFTLENLLTKLEQQRTKLAEHRVEIEPELYDKYLQHRELVNKKVPREPNFIPNTLYPGTWYLKSIDQNYRRTYDRVSKEAYSLENTRKALLDQLCTLK
ncbi:hydroxymethylglutaryl- synthase 1, partial [Brachionus plicatilis]